MKFSGKVTISRVMCNQGPDYVSLQIEDTKSGTRVLEAAFDLETWGSLVAGMSYRSVEGIELWPENVGKTREIKHEVVAVDTVYPRTLAERKAAAARALKPYEVDGWRGYEGDLFNSHRSAGNGSYTVTFTRFVPSHPKDSE
jgi:hypothetical protein